MPGEQSLVHSHVTAEPKPMLGITLFLHISILIHPTALNATHFIHIQKYMIGGIVDYTTKRITEFLFLMSQTFIASIITRSGEEDSV